MSETRERNIGQEILDGIREIKRGEVGRVITFPPAAETRALAGQPVDLPESSEVEVEVRSLASSAEERHLDAVYAILEERFQSGEADVAASTTSISLDRLCCPFASCVGWVSHGYSPTIAISRRLVSRFCFEYSFVASLA